MNIAVFASHNGSDLQAIIDACESKAINARVCAVISNNGDSKALERAEISGIDNYHVSVKVCGDEDSLDSKILDILDSHETDIIFLAGYLKKIGVPILRKYHNKIFNIHPALLPKFGGKGMYGMNVHKAVIEAKEAVSGITVHRVSENYDEGAIVAQTSVEVMENDTPETLAERILACEHVFIVEVLKRIISGEISTSPNPYRTDKMITFRKANVSDADNLAKIRSIFMQEVTKCSDADCHETEISNKAYFKIALADNSFAAWLALDGDKIIGTSGLSFSIVPPALHFDGKAAYIMNMYTFPEYRNQGIASELFKRTVEEAKNRGYKRISLHATEMGRTLYEKYGFTDSHNEMIFKFTENE